MYESSQDLAISAPGSLSDTIKGRCLSAAEAFLEVDVILVIDVSGSMAAKDAPGGVSRYDAAEKELRKLQEEMPGKIGVVGFSDRAAFCPGGVPERIGRSTDMAEALRLVLPMDGLASIILISDGCPNSESETLDVASRFEHKIDTVFIGSSKATVWGTSGENFLKSLAAATGGQAAKGKAPGLLKNEVVKLLTAGRGKQQ